MIVCRTAAVTFTDVAPEIEPTAAVTVVDPKVFAVITPEASTLATVVLELVQVTPEDSVPLVPLE